jgi:membrane protein DedA with SNARE-associated domain
MCYAWFSVATMAGAIPWNFVLAYAGFKLGQHYETVATTLHPFVIPIAIVVVILLGVAWWAGRKLGEDEEAAVLESSAEIKR